jgi:D-2-hydroxyacid dehydrogenase (NADP+)
MDEETVAQIEAVDPAVRVVQLPQIGSQNTPDAETKAKLLALMEEVEILIGQSSVSPEYLLAAGNLKWFQVINAGVDRMAKEGLLSRGFAVTNVSGLTAPAIAEYVIGTMVMMAKGLHFSVREQAEHRWARHPVGELAGKTLGIAGMGAIGRETARRARAFNMRVVATRRTVSRGDRDPDCDDLLPYSDLDRLLGVSDYLALCVPLTPETHHLIGEKELKAMKPTACIVNIARGPVIDQEALIRALREGTIAGAALDVTDPEPLPPESPLWDLPNVILTPHISGGIDRYVARAVEMFIQNLRRYIAGEALENVVSAQLGY